jgi:hypothetical protein
VSSVRTAVVVGASSLVVGAVAAPANGAVISKFTFESYTAPTTATTSVSGIGADEGTFAGTAQASSVHASAATFSTPVGNGSTKSLSANTYSQGDYFQFTTPTTGFSGIQLLVDQVASGTGPTSWKVAYSTDGSTFTDLPGGAYTVSSSVSFASATEKTTNPPRYLFDFSSITGLDNQPSIALRLIDTSATGATAGTSRIDNVTIGTNLPVPTPAPEPGVLSLAAVASAGMLGRRRRR